MLTCVHAELVSRLALPDAAVAMLIMHATKGQAVSALHSIEQALGVRHTL